MLGVMSDRQVFGLVDPFALWVDRLPDHDGVGGRWPRAGGVVICQWSTTS